MSSSVMQEEVLKMISETSCLNSRQDLHVISNQWYFVYNNYKEISVKRPSIKKIKDHDKKHYDKYIIVDILYVCTVMFCLCVNTRKQLTKLYYQGNSCHDRMKTLRSVSTFISDNQHRNVEKCTTGILYSTQRSQRGTQAYSIAFRS